jgi:hypothetical protein
MFMKIAFVGFWWEGRQLPRWPARCDKQKEEPQLVWRPWATSSMENTCLQNEENFPTHNKN